MTTTRMKLEDNPLNETNYGDHICYIGFCGPTGVGKDASAALCKQIIMEYCPDLNVAILSLADPIRAAVEAMYGLPRNTLADSRETKESEAPCAGGKTYRNLLQTLGTEWGRQLVSDTFWIDLLQYRAAEVHFADVVLVPDVRFYNEYELLIKKNNGYLIEIVGEGIEHGGDTAHASEQGLTELSQVSVAHIMNHKDGYEAHKNRLLPVIEAIVEDNCTKRRYNHAGDYALD